MHWLRSLVLLVCLGGLQYPLWFGKGSVKELRVIKERVKEQKIEVNNLEQRNRAMAAQIQDLKQGKEAVAEIARDELGFIGEKEHYYRVPK